MPQGRQRPVTRFGPTNVAIHAVVIAADIGEPVRGWLWRRMSMRSIRSRWGGCSSVDRGSCGHGCGGSCRSCIVPRSRSVALGRLCLAAAWRCASPPRCWSLVARGRDSRDLPLQDRAGFVKPGATVIDIGTNYPEDGAAAAGRRCREARREAGERAAGPSGSGGPLRWGLTPTAGRRAHDGARPVDR